MAEGLNRVTLLGNLGADPELRHTQGGAVCLNLRLATTESYLDKDKQRQERTEWHSIVLWGNRAEGLARILSKGATIAVEGSIRTEKWQDRDGVEQKAVKIHAHNIVLCGGGRRDGAAQGGEPRRRRRDPETEDTPDPFQGGDDSSF